MSETKDNSRAKQVGERIVAVRAHRGLSAKQLAEKAGIHANSLCSLEKGHSEPKPVTLRKLAQALECDVDELRGTSPLYAPSEPAVADFVEAFSRKHSLFKGRDDMRQRFRDLAVKMAVSNEFAANELAKRVTKEFHVIDKLLELFDAGQDLDAVATIVSEHKQLRSRAATSNGRVDAAHGLSPAHSSAALAAG